MFNSRSLSKAAPAAIVIALSTASGSAQEPGLTIGGVTTEGLLVSTTGVSISRSVPIINTQKAEVDVSIDVPRLIGPDSSSIDTKWDLNGQASSPLSAKIPPLGSAQLTMTTELPVVGTYQGTLSLIYGEKRFPFAIKITRTASQPGVTVTGLSAMAFEGLDSRAIDFNLKETAGARVLLHPPRVLSLTRKVGDKNLQVQASGVTFHVVGQKGETPIAQSLAIDRNVTVPIVMRVPGASEPGEYTGSLHIASAEGALAAVPFTFYVRRSGLLCALLIALGVVLSQALRNYVKSGRPRLILARRFVQLDADIDTAIDGFADAEDRDLLGDLKRRIERAASDAEVGQTAEVDATLKDIDAKLSVVAFWSTLRRRIAGVTPSDLADQARPVLDDARRFLTANRNETADRIQKEVTSIREALTKIDTAIREQLTSDIAATRKRAEAAAADLSPERQAAFKRDVLVALTEAEAAIKLSPPDDKGARQKIDDARRAYARLVARELDEKLDRVERPPAISEADWNAMMFAFRKNVEVAGSAATGPEAVAAYESAYGEYLRILIRVATESVNTLRPVVPATEPQAHAALDKAEKALNLARTRLRQRDVDAARASYEEAKTAIDPVEQQFGPQVMSGPGGQPEPSLGSAASRVSLDLADPVSLDEARERHARQWPSLADIDKQLKSRDRMVSWITGGVAVLFGVYLIWIDNLTWGSAKDMAASVFWGLGLHQVAGNTLFAKLDLEEFESHLTGRKVEKSGATP